jgi:hypothetical protein
VYFVPAGCTLGQAAEHLGQKMASVTELQPWLFMKAAVDTWTFIEIAQGLNQDTKPERIKALEESCWILLCTLLKRIRFFFLGGGGGKTEKLHTQNNGKYVVVIQLLEASVRSCNVRSR